MSFLRRFLENHVLANLTFVLILILGFIAYSQMPRERDPELNFHWVDIITVLPGASSAEVEKRVTDPLEEAINQRIKDIRFSASTSRNGLSTILLRFKDISDREFEKRMNDLRREVQNVYTDQLPDEALDPDVRELTTSSAFPTAVVALSSPSMDDEFRRYSENLKKRLERINGVDEALAAGLGGPELHIAFDPSDIQGLGISPVDISDTVRSYFQDASIGDVETKDGRWQISLEGTTGSLQDLEQFPIVGANGVVPLSAVADIYFGQSEAGILTRYQGKPAVMYTLTKQKGGNMLDVLDRTKAFLEQESGRIEDTGYTLTLIDDQTVSTREAIGLMVTNSLIGLLLVVFVAYLFLGGRIAALTGIGIPFTLAATFVVLNYLEMSVNNTVLLGILISLGMLVDDAVVVVEAIHYRIQRGADSMTAAIESLREVAAPVFTSVMTTISVFFPLMLLPGILGDYMMVIPLVVCIALAISLIEAFWMLPAHVSFLNVGFNKESRTQILRRRFTRAIRHNYSKLLIVALRRPRLAFASVILMVGGAFGLLAGGFVNFNFFAADPLRVLYINAELPQGVTLEQSVQVGTELEQRALANLKPEEVRNSIVYSGQMLTQTEPIFGDNLAQVFISIQPAEPGMRDIREIVRNVEEDLGTQYREAKVTVTVLEDGPPAGKPISMKVKGDRFEEVQIVVDRLLAFMKEKGDFSNTTTDFKLGTPELKLALDGDAIQRAGLSPNVVIRSLQSYVDGELITQYQHLGEEVDVRILPRNPVGNVEQVLQQSIVNRDGDAVSLSSLVHAEYGFGYQNIRHYNFQRAITIESDIANEELDTIAANALLLEYWETIQFEHPNVSIDFSGALDDIQETLDGIAGLFVIGLGLIYLILGTQFKSYGQPIMVLVAVPLAISGVIYGLVLTGNPMSLSTMYGVVALSGISVNSAIVLISAANDRIGSGMSVLHATVYAARRRVVPVLITSFTTIAGLFSLAAGVAGESLLWGPIATAIVSGLMFSTVLVLIVIPLLYFLVGRSSRPENSDGLIKRLLKKVRRRSVPA